MYFAPYIDKTGLHMPSYLSIRDELIEQCKSIFGQDIYLKEDSQDYQWIATISEKIYDAFQLSQAVYNNRSPVSAMGVGLDGIIKINGIKRKSATYSKCEVILSGLKDTKIHKGIILDKGNIQWKLPTEVIIPEECQINVIATCSIPGPIVANPGDLVDIFNPTYGWNGVYNNENADLGSYVEDDSKLRLRQSQGTAQASVTMLEGTKGAIAQLKGVTRLEVYENDTDIINEKGLPPHSITAVVEGGLDFDIANAIFTHRGLGCFINGDVILDITDSKLQVTPIRFFRPLYVDVCVEVNIKQLNGYTSDTTENIKKNLQTYLNSLEIGANLSLSALWGAALQAMPNLMNPMFSVLSIICSRLEETLGTEDLELNFKEVCRGNIKDITVNIT